MSEEVKVYKCRCGNEMAVAAVGIPWPETVECDECGGRAKIEISREK